MKKVVFALLALLIATFSRAQESLTDYNFLRLPVSAHVSALGGDNITITDDDPTMMFHNPALMTGVTDKSINLNYMTYMEGTKTASATFVKSWNERTTWGVMAQFMDYGSMKEVTVDHVILGDFSARDIMIGGSLAYRLGNKFSGGITAKFVSSSIAGYSSMAVGVDLGLNYYNPDDGLSISAVVRNLGGQVKAYDDDFERIPLDLQVGITKRLQNSPLRFSFTMTHLNDWESFSKHLVIGADLLLSEQIYISGGYNFRRADEMKISDGEGESNHGAGLSIGGGLHLNRFKLDVAWAKYHVTTSSLLFNITYTL